MMHRLKAFRIFTNKPARFTVLRAVEGRIPVPLTKGAVTSRIYWVSAGPETDWIFADKADFLISSLDGATMLATPYFDDDTVPWLEGVDIAAELEAQAQWRALLNSVNSVNARRMDG